MRLDEYLVKHCNLKSRTLAKQYITNGYVKVNHTLITKPSYELTTDKEYSIVIEETMKYVSRAGYKLAKAIEEFKIDCNNKIVLDLGTSTGGFCDCCLQNGAKKVFCVDVGSNQLDQKLINHPKIINLENLNIKNLNQTIINESIDIVVSDLSFISSKYMFEAIENIKLNNHAQLITLIKPQFELANEIVKKEKFCIKNPKYLDKAINQVKAFALTHHWTIKGIVASPIKGAKKENQEYLLWCEKNE